MTEVTVFLDRPDGVRLTVAGRAGRSLMRAAQAAGVEGIAADCGGVVSCATCHVFVAPPWADLLEPPDEDQEAMCWWRRNGLRACHRPSLTNWPCWR